MRRPTYQKKTDRIVNPQATQDEIKCDVAKPVEAKDEQK